MRLPEAPDFLLIAHPDYAAGTLYCARCFTYIRLAAFWQHACKRRA